MEKPRLIKSKEQIELEERVNELEKRVATLEGLVQEQHRTVNITFQLPKQPLSDQQIEQVQEKLLKVLDRA